MYVPSFKQVEYVELIPPGCDNNYTHPARYGQKYETGDCLFSKKNLVQSSNTEVEDNHDIVQDKPTSIAISN